MNYAFFFLNAFVQTALLPGLSGMVASDYNNGKATYSDIPSINATGKINRSAFIDTLSAKVMIGSLSFLFLLGTAAAFYNYRTGYITRWLKKVKPDSDKGEGELEADYPKDKDYDRKRRLLTATFFCLVLFVAEFIGGYFSSSLAIMSDSFHLLTDVVAYSISYASLVYGARPRSDKYSYGYKRLEVVGTMVSVILMWFLSAALIMVAVDRLKHPEEVHGQVMLYVAISGIFVNILLIFIFSHCDAMDDNDNNTKSFWNSLTAKNQKDLNIRAAMIHAIGDLLCSMGVVIAAIIINVNPKLAWIDSLCTIVFAVVALSTTFGIIYITFRYIKRFVHRNNAGDAEPY